MLGRLPSRLLGQQQQRENQSMKKAVHTRLKIRQTYHSKNLGQSFLGRQLPFLYVLQFALKKHKLAFRFAVKKGRNDKSRVFRHFKQTTVFKDFCSLVRIIPTGEDVYEPKFVIQ